MQRRTVIFECRNYGYELRDAVLDSALDAALDAARAAWQHWHICSSESMRVLVLTTSQPVISLLSSSLSTKSESFCCFKYLSMIIYMTWTLVEHRGRGRRYSAVVVFLRLSYQKKIIITMVSIVCNLYETLHCYFIGFDLHFNYF